MEHEYVAARRAAKYYDCSSKTLAAWCDRGLVDFRLSGQRRYAIPVTPRKEKVRVREDEPAVRRQPW